MEQVARPALSAVTGQIFEGPLELASSRRQLRVSGACGRCAIKFRVQSLSCGDSHCGYRIGAPAMGVQDLGLREGRGWDDVDVIG